MGRIIKSALGITLFLAFLASTFLWFEAEKEVRILCSMIGAGQAVEAATHTLETGHFLQYREVEFQDGMGLIVDSPYTLGTSRCQLQISTENVILRSQYMQSFRLDTVAAWAGISLLAGLAIFQLLLAAGLPLGKLAWGGRYERLPTRLRIGSALSVLILLFAALILLEKAQVIRVLEAPNFMGYAVWILAILFGLSTLGNLNSQSEAERKVMTPIAILLCYICIAVGMAG